MKCASVPSVYMNVMLRVSVRTGRNFSPALKVLSMTLPSVVRLSFVRTKAPPLPGFTCWNSTTLKIVPSTSMWIPFLNWLVLITAPRLATARHPTNSGLDGQAPGVGARLGERSPFLLEEIEVRDQGLSHARLD